jgi:hypothetical protein
LISLFYTRQVEESSPSEKFAECRKIGAALTEAAPQDFFEEGGID